MAKILLVDDDTTMSQALRSFLVDRSHVVETAESGEDALQLMTNFSFDVIVLDWNLPGVTGETVCLEYRKRGGRAPIIFLTGQNDISFLERGIHAGGDDYMTKPFEVRELAARLTGLLRRSQAHFVGELRAGKLLLRPELNTIFVDEQKVVLRPKETALLEFFLRNQNHIFAAQEVIDGVWASESSASTSTVRTWMGLLRHKLQSVGCEHLIRTIPGAGYILDADAS